jgi:hypothetical protein
MIDIVQMQAHALGHCLLPAKEDRRHSVLQCRDSALDFSLSNDLLETIPLISVQRDSVKTPQWVNCDMDRECIVTYLTLHLKGLLGLLVPSL